MTDSNSIIITNDDDTQKDKNFPVIMETIQHLINSGFISNLGGNCVAAAEMVSMMLHQSGVDTTIMECQVSIKRTNEDGNAHFGFIGFNGMGLGPNSVDTHVVTIVKGENPILIDVSIWPSLPGDHPFIVERVNQNTPGVIADYDYGEFRVTYTPKKDLKLPNLHQRSILDRLKAEETIKSKLGWVAYIAAGALGISLFNTILNIIIVYFRVLGEM